MVMGLTGTPSSPTRASGWRPDTGPRWAYGRSPRSMTGKFSHSVSRRAPIAARHAATWAAVIPRDTT